MKTTNFFIDFMIVGTLFLLSLFISWIMLDPNLIERVLYLDTKVMIMALPIMTILTYVLGIIFNQIADDVLHIFAKIYKLEDMFGIRGDFDREFGKSYHECLQAIVHSSKSSYEYLSYRRSVIRITRALIIGLTSVIVIHLLAIIISPLIMELIFSKINLTIIITSLLLLIFLRYRLVKLQTGYYFAIKNFYAIIQEDISINTDGDD